MDTQKILFWDILISEKKYFGDFGHPKNNLGSFDIPKKYFGDFGHPEKLIFGLKKIGNFCIPKKYYFGNFFNTLKNI